MQKETLKATAVLAGLIVAAVVMIVAVGMHDVATGAGLGMLIALACAGVWLGEARREALYRRALNAGMPYTEYNQALLNAKRSAQRLTTTFVMVGVVVFSAAALL